MNVATWLFSLFAGRWKLLVVLLLVALVLGFLYGLGRSHANARWEARMAETVAAYTEAARVVQADADATVARQVEVASIAVENYAHAQTEIARVAGLNAALQRRVQDRLRAGRDQLPPAHPDPERDQPAGQRLDAGAVGASVAGVVDFAGTCARRADDLAAQVNGLLQAWPR